MNRNIIFILIIGLLLLNCEYFNLKSYEEWGGSEDNSQEGDDSSEEGGGGGGSGSTYIATGELDTSFDPGTGANSTVRSIAIQSDGRILICGQFTSYDGTARNYIARINADGSLDTSFDPGTGANNYVYSITIQNDGRILICGQFTSYNGTARNRIARINADGSLDASFDPGTGADNYVFSAPIQNDGRIIIGGNFNTYNGTARNCIARVNTDGLLDASFDPGTGADNFIQWMTIQVDGRVLIGGDFGNYNGIARNRIARVK